MALLANVEKKISISCHMPKPKFTLRVIGLVLDAICGVTATGWFAHQSGWETRLVISLVRMASAQLRSAAPEAIVVIGICTVVLNSGLMSTGPG